MSKKMNAVLVACVTVLLCVAMILTGTYALFSDTLQVNTHLQAGTMKIRLTRTKLEYNVLEDGLLVDKTNGDTLVYSDPQGSETVTNENVFGITDATLVVPGSSYTATMSVENKSDVAFTYYMEIKCTDTTKNKLAEQLSVTVTAYDGDETKNTVATGLTVGSESEPVGTVKVGESQTFQVNVTFTDSDDNNAAQGQEVHFDLVVYAVQATN